MYPIIVRNSVSSACNLHQPIPNANPGTSVLNLVNCRRKILFTRHQSLLCVLALSLRVSCFHSRFLYPRSCLLLPLFLLLFDPKRSLNSLFKLLKFSRSSLLLGIVEIEDILGLDKASSNCSSSDDDSQSVFS
ncbi:unnamed protein product [Rhizophagus irregularis]|nr:unnamed protein product [Rhizophagus irregularis]